jgi:hypothetical protein
MVGGRLEIRDWRLEIRTTENREQRTEYRERRTDSHEVPFRKVHQRAQRWFTSPSRNLHSTGGLNGLATLSGSVRKFGDVLGWLADLEPEGHELARMLTNRLLPFYDASTSVSNQAFRFVMIGPIRVPLSWTPLGGIS